MRSRLPRLLILALALGMVAAACSKKSESGEGGKITINGESANNHGTKDFSGKSEGDVEMDNFYFDPTVIKGSPGQTLQSGILEFHCKYHQSSGMVGELSA